MSSTDTDLLSSFSPLTKLFAAEPFSQEDMAVDAEKSLSDHVEEGAPNSFILQDNAAFEVDKSVPRPSDDPEDPLNWPLSLKVSL
jgi:hypothetical protein